jgi:hypothetical protein
MDVAKQTRKTPLFQGTLDSIRASQAAVGIHHAALDAPSRNTALLVGMLVHAGVCENQWLLPVQCPEHNVQHGNTDTKIRPRCFEMVYHVPPFLSG